MTEETGGNWNDSLEDRKKKNAFLKTSLGAGGEIFFILESIQWLILSLHILLYFIKSKFS